MKDAEEVDVLVVGGGPSGAATALRLASFGKRVVLCEKGTFPRPHVGESLPAGIRSLLDVLGVRAEVETSGVLLSRCATVAWAHEITRHEVHGGPSLLVDRAHFDAALLRAAAARPEVTLHQPATAAHVAFRDGRWDVLLNTGKSFRARYLVEATGRSRLLRRKRRALGAPTQAVVAYFRGGPGSPEGDTLIEAGDDCWYWGASLPGGEFCASVFLSAGASGPSYSERLALSKLLAPCLRGAKIARGPLLSPASAYVAEEVVGEAHFKVGDAALALDPISSQGVYTGIGTALHAAVALHTMLDRPEDADLAIDFYRRRVTASATFHQRAAADFYARQAAVSDSPFWSARAAFSAPRERHKRAPLRPEERVRLSPGTTFAKVPVVTETHIVPREGVRLNGEPYAFLDEDIALAPLLREVKDPCRAVDLVQIWSRTMPPERALRVLQWMWSEGFLEVLRL